MRIGSLFSGIGGLELGLEWAGVGRTVFQVELDTYCQSVLARHWPNAERFTDVCSVGRHNLPPVDLLCGGFPCQDVSVANRAGAGLSGARSGLWSQFERVAQELQPTWIVVENVGHGSSRWVDGVERALERHGYQTLPIPLAAQHCGAPHVRSRFFVVAFAIGQPLRQLEQRIAARQPHRVQDEGQAQPVDPGTSGRWAALPSLCRDDDGIPTTLDAARLRALGNAVVPQCAEVVGHVVLRLSAHLGATS